MTPYLPGLAKLLQRPDLPILVDALQRHLADERQRRVRFREEITPAMKAEFINGVIIMHSPAQLRHLDVTRRLAFLIGVFAQEHRLGTVMIEKAMISTSRNDYEPDVVFYRAERRRDFCDEQLLFPAPDLIAEVLSPSTEKTDRGVKLRDYALNEVPEYWIVDPEAQRVETYVFDPDTRGYQHTATLAGHAEAGDVPLRVATLPGFVVPVRALFDDDANAAALRALLAIPPPPAA